MDLRHDLPDKLSFEDRIDELSRLALLVLLLVTLVSIASLRDADPGRRRPGQPAANFLRSGSASCTASVLASTSACRGLRKRHASIGSLRLYEESLVINRFPPDFLSPA